ncbi:hypothetical protein [Pseudoalteromonas denitrificans]|uniref:Uncharacterized protein n=1 Tax=Pseudoalteromonas denitrificans DSM 6059 TaxID=1123010 RepID=A0A1I1RRZ1_9GAMM|nr:hypothetical protein [Pseudoalteromonas denitrificans]SFD37104.1 hypothetical protein SAMN02745724_04323 [Pseudoalteromonas denitrificans DSM 6059]
MKNYNTIKNVISGSILVTMLGLSGAAFSKDKIKTDVKVSKNTSIGVIKPQKKDKRTHTDKEIKKHKESMSGKSTVGVKHTF